jgi:rhamnosyltransferase
MLYCCPAGDKHLHNLILKPVNNKIKAVKNCKGPSLKVSIIIPTYQASPYLDKLLKKLSGQTVFRNKAYQIETIIVDSSSTDDTLRIAEKYKTKIMTVKKEEFDHGWTRTLAGRASKGEVIVYLTQDALPADEKSIENLISPFFQKSGDVPLGAVYGRQVPYPDATPFAAHSRYFIYPGKSYSRTLSDKDRYKIKTAFLSNAFSAYLREAMEEIGWFKSNLISTEDTYAGALMLLKGYRLAYTAGARVYHSHNYTVAQEFKRYFDIGSFHKNESWIIKEFGKANDEGIKYIISELKSILKLKKFYLLPEFLLRNFLKFTGYKLGYHFQLLPEGLILKWSMHRGWWLKNKNFGK